MAQYAPLCDAVHQVSNLAQLGDAVDKLFTTAKPAALRMLRLKRSVGWWGGSGTGTRLLILANAAGPAAQAGASGAYRLLLPLLLVPPGPLYFPLLFKPLPPPVVDLAVSRIEIIQGVTLSDAYTVQVAGRPALVRVFVSLTGAGTQPGVSARLTRYLGGNAQDSLDAGRSRFWPPPARAAWPKRSTSACLATGWQPAPRTCSSLIRQHRARDKRRQQSLSARRPAVV